MSVWLKQSTAVTVKMGPFVDSTDGNTEETALTISQADIRLSKNGGAFAQTNNAAGATHDANGMYGVPLDTTDTDTLGTLKVYIHESGALAVWQEFMVVPANVWDSLFGADKLQVHADEITAGLITAAAIATGAIDADALAADAVAEIADGVWDEDATGHQTDGTFGFAIGDPTDHDSASILTWVDDMYALVTDVKAKTDSLTFTNAGLVDVNVLYWVNDIVSVPTSAGVPSVATIALSALGQADVRAAVGLATANLDTQLTAIDNFLDTEVAAILAAVDTEVAAIKAKTDSLTFTTANRVDSQVFGMENGTVTAAAVATDAIDADAIAADAVTEIQSGLATAANLATVAGYLDTEIAAILEDTGTTLPAQIAALNNLSAAQVNAEVVDALNVDTYAEPAGAPAATASLVAKIGRLHQMARNRLTVTSTTMSFYSDAGAVIWTKALSDDGTTYDEAEGA